MAIKKQAFYEGAALHIVARAGGVTNIKYDAPFFLLNDRLLVFLKYCTKGRSPWGFTFTPSEQIILAERNAKSEIIIGLVCGADGVAAISYNSYLKLAQPQASALHIACYRQHNEHYEIKGPSGVLSNKVLPSRWQRILEYQEAVA
jgi:hypothetical protein